MNNNWQMSTASSKMKNAFHYNDDIIAVMESPITDNLSRVTGPLWGGTTEDRWIPLTKGKWRCHIYTLYPKTYAHGSRSVVVYSGLAPFQSTHILQAYDYYCTSSPGGRFKNTYELLNLRALKISKLHKNHIFQCMGKIFCVEFQRVPLKFHTKYLTHTLKDVDFINIWKFKSSLI